jgi:microcompartment protein CcmL/EutN
MGLVELNSVARGMMTADDMVKEANVELVLARPVCPGRYLIMVAGETAAVQRSVDKGLLTAGQFIADHFVLTHIHADVFPAINSSTIVPEIRAIGVIETYSSSSAVVAADKAVKAAGVDLVEIRLATGLAGKAVVVLTGRIGSVQAAVDAGCQTVAQSGLLLGRAVLSSPSREMKKQILM